MAKTQKKKKTEKRGTQGPTLDQNNNFGGLLGQRSTSGVAVSDKTAMQLTAFWAGVEILSQAVAKIKIELSRETTDGRMDPQKSDPRYKMVANQPNPFQTAGELWSAVVTNALVYRDGYAEIIRDEAGSPVELRHIESWRVRPTPRTANGDVELETMVYGVDRRNDWDFVRPENMIHIRAQSLDGICGMPIPEYVRDAVGTAISRRNFAGAFFRRGGRPGGVLKTPKNWDKKDREALERDFRQMYENEEALFKTLSMPGGDAIKFEPTEGVTLESTQMIEGQEFDVREAGRLLNIQPHLLGDMTAANYNTLEQQQGAFWTVSLSNWTGRIANQCWLRLLTPEERRTGELWFSHKLNTLDYADSQVTAEVASKLVTAGVMTQNDARRLFNLPPIETGNELLTPPGNVKASENGNDQTTDSMPDTA